MAKLAGATGPRKASLCRSQFWETGSHSREERPRLDGVDPEADPLNNPTEVDP